MRRTFGSFGLDEEQANIAHQMFGASVNGLVNTGGGALIDQLVALYATALESRSWPEVGGSAPISRPAA